MANLLNIYALNVKQNISTEAVEMLDEEDSFGVDLSEPPNFNCKNIQKK